MKKYLVKLKKDYIVGAEEKEHLWEQATKKLVAADHVEPPNWESLPLKK